MFFEPQPLHFTGIGGSGMSALAAIAHAMGCAVSGSDLVLSPATDRLARLGIRVRQGHDAANLPPEAKALIVTSAARDDNAEVAEARRRGLPVVTRGELLAEIMRSRRAVAVAGSHGKTTVTSMLAATAIEAGLDPTVALGAPLPALGGSNARIGAGAWMIAESDESDGSFLLLHPELAILTNIDREHLDHYGSFDAARQAFTRFANQVCLAGALIACVDDAEVRDALAGVRRRVVTYGHAPSSAVRVTEARSGAAGSDFILARHGEPLGEFHLPVLGAHNILNAAAAAAAALEMNIPAGVIRRALASFEGPARRMERKGVEQGVTVVDDYGHHPTEIRATLDALRLLAPKRLIVLFQPHRYTRTQALMQEFAGAFDVADAVRVLDIYAASEPPMEGVSAQTLVQRLRDAGHRDVLYSGSLAGAVASVLVELRDGDLVLTLGAGSITQAGDMILKGLRKENGHG